jgi:hypothetical protein
MSENEIDAATEAQVDEFNSQHQTPITWEPSFNVAGSFFDQAVRSGQLAGAKLDKVSKHLARAENLADQADDAAVVAQLQNAMRVLGGSGDQGELKQALRDLADSLG